MEMVTTTRSPLPSPPAGNGLTPERSPLSHLAALAGTPPIATKERNAGKVVSRLNQHLEEQKKSLQASELPCKVRVLSRELPTPFRYLAETLDSKVSAVRWRLQDWQRALQPHLPSGISCMPVNVITQDDVFVVGHIICDAEAGRLNAASTVLEGLAADGGAARAHLDLSRVPLFQIFPGQVVGARGVSLDGSTFIVKELYTHLPKPLAAISPSAALQEAPAYWSLVVASGPFTTSDNHDYKPLKDLLDYCHSTSPSALLLLGPLVDERHPQLEQLDTTCDQLAAAAEKLLADWADTHSGCRLMLMSSTRDVHHHPVFPTPPFSLKAGLSGKVLALQNPCVFNCNDVVLGACSTDVLLHLSGEVAQFGQHPDRLAAIAGNLIGQHRFYPLNPPAIGTCLDTTFHSHLELPVSPNILVLPSDLTPFAKLVPVKQTLPIPHANAPLPGNVVCINPGRLAKGQSFGTFARVTLLPAAAAGSGIAVPPAAERCMVEIINV